MDIDFWIALLAFLVAIVMLVVSHELGHFWAARLFGIKVETFSIGFGPKLFRRKSKKGTEYAFSLIPFGGYVKLLETPWNAVEHTEEERKHAFNLQSLWKRSIVILMGPAFSILFAVLLFAVIFLIGYKAPKAKIGYIFPNSPAAEAQLEVDDEIIQIDDTAVAHWPQALIKLLRYIGEDKDYKLEVENQGQVSEHLLVIEQKGKKTFQPDRDFLGTLGFTPWEPESPAAILTRVSFGNSAYWSGLEVGDQIISVNGEEVKNYQHFVRFIKRNPQTPMKLRVLRNSEVIEKELTPRKKYKFFFTFYYGFAGVEGPKPMWPADTEVTQRYNFLNVWGHALQVTWDYLDLMCVLLYKLCTGVISFFHLAGPLSIAHFAGIALQQGFVNFLFFVAIFSINLGIINLLPIPGLDGGHLLFYAIEGVRKKPVNPALQGMLIKWAIGASIVLLGHVISNDLQRLAKSFEALAM